MEINEEKLICYLLFMEFLWSANDCFALGESSLFFQADVISERSKGKQAFTYSKFNSNYILQKKCVDVIQMVNALDKKGDDDISAWIT